MIVCKNSDYEVLNHFSEVGKMVDIGSDTKREIKEKLGWYNGDEKTSLK